MRSTLHALVPPGMGRLRRAVAGGAGEDILALPGVGRSQRAGEDVRQAVVEAVVVGADEAQRRPAELPLEAREAGVEVIGQAVRLEAVEVVLPQPRRARVADDRPL